MTLTIYIIGWNRDDWLPACLELLHQAHKFVARVRASVMARSKQSAQFTRSWSEQSDRQSPVTLPAVIFHPY